MRDDTGGAGLVIYLKDGRLLRALVIVDGSASLRSLGEYAAAGEAVLRLRADLDAQAGRALPGRVAEAVAAATRQDAAALTAAVLSPLLPELGDRDLVVVPAGVLATVPWAVLPGCAGRPVTVAPSATAWHAARHRLGAISQPGPGGPGPQAAALLVAGPGNDRGDAEVRAIAALRPGSSVLTGASATPAATLAGLGTAAIAHLAAHGLHQAENALCSTLELAGGPLLGYDLQRAARAPSMVVLSSCDLGLTDVRPGDETFGMVTALLTAGAGTVVASVARVADDTAMAAMIGYHQAIMAGSAPAAALATALRRETAAGFVCFGAGSAGAAGQHRRRAAADQNCGTCRNQVAWLVGCATSNVTPERFPPASKLPVYWPSLPFGQATTNSNELPLSAPDRLASASSAPLEFSSLAAPCRLPSASPPRESVPARCLPVP